GLVVPKILCTALRTLSALHGKQNHFLRLSRSLERNGQINNTWLQPFSARTAADNHSLSLRLFEYRGRVSPAPRTVPVKRQRVSMPLVRRVKSALPVKLLARSAALAGNSARLKLRSNEIQTIKTELTQIKSNIDALLGRLEQLTGEHKPCA
ncbi:hypothetical protein FKM82_027095, partial [Ascaphus truei]